MSETRQIAVASTATQQHAAGERIERHRHDEHQILYSSSGALAVTTDSGSWIAPPDRAIWIPAGAWHAHRFYGPTSLHCVGLALGENALGLQVPSVLAVRPLLRELLVECSSTALPDAELARIRRVLVDQLRHCPSRPVHLPAPEDERLVRACAIVEHDLERIWALSELGAEVGASERTLTRLFRSDLGMSYPQWRTQLRLYRALQLLAESLPVTTVARRCGWASTSAFIDVYRRVLGHTPGAYGQL